MRHSMAMAREEKRHVLSGQYRFTEWVAGTPPTGKAGSAYGRSAPEGIRSPGIHARGEAAPGTSGGGGIPQEILRWYSHFEGRGIPAAIVRRRDGNVYAVIRQGTDHAADWEEEPDLIEKTDVHVLRKCHGFTLSVQEY